MEDGVWRTIGGRRVFIQKGQRMSDAMKKSGKFNFKNKKMKTKKNDEDTIAEKEFEEASKIDEKLDRAIQMQVADDVGKELDDDDIRFRAENYVRNNYNGNASDEEIFERLKSAYKNRGWYKESESKINKEANSWNNRNSYKKGDTIEYDTKYPLGLTEKWKKGEVIEVKNDWASHGDTHPDKIYKVKDLENGNVYEVSAGAVSKKISSNSTNEGSRKQSDDSALSRSTKALNDIDKIAGDDEKLQRLGRSMGSSSFARWNKAFNEYKKEHPNTKLDLYKFIKMNE